MPPRGRPPHLPNIAGQTAASAPRQTLSPFEDSDGFEMERLREEIEQLH
jgi:hypothetical protein